MEREMYRDCMRNHAATLGTYATDGCGEYTPDPSNHAALTCAACGCHRNFHRKVPVSPPPFSVGGAYYSPSTAEDRTPDGRKRARTKFSAEQKERMLRFAERIGWRIPRRDAGEADELGRFCREIGVSRQIFKVWMHNHKNSSSTTTSSSALGGAMPSATAASAALMAASANGSSPLSE